MVDSRFPQRSASFRPESKRWVPPFLFSRHFLFALIWAFAFIVIIAWQRAAVDRRWAPPVRPIPKLRSLVFNLTDFGAVGDGFTGNTKASERAISEIQRRGGGQLNVEAGRWLTAPFNLTSHMTLFLAQHAVIIGIDDEKYWPLMPPLPSYGYGREQAGPRFGSLIHGQNLRDVIITGPDVVDEVSEEGFEPHKGSTRAVYVVKRHSNIRCDSARFIILDSFILTTVKMLL